VFSQLTELQELDLSGNFIFGSIPHEVAGLPKLVVFRMSNNQLSGPLPLFTSTSLKELDLENNLLSGTISSTLGIGLTSMTNFNLNHKHLS
jgi:LRR receptor-like serine/threonine-protein kinase FLS2